MFKIQPAHIPIFDLTKQKMSEYTKNFSFFLKHQQQVELKKELDQHQLKILCHETETNAVCIYRF